jgi:uncharacterized protein (DUF302 family)
MIPPPANRRSFQQHLEGLTSIESSFGPKETVDRLQKEIHAHGMIIFARIDHTAGATAVGLSLRPTELIIFGNARGGSPLMQAVQTVGVDLPLKALVWEDADGQTWLSYNEPRWIAERHGITGTKPVLSEIAAMVSAVSKAATNS